MSDTHNISPLGDEQVVDGLDYCWKWILNLFHFSILRRYIYKEVLFRMLIILIVLTTCMLGYVVHSFGMDDVVGIPVAELIGYEVILYFIPYVISVVLPIAFFSAVVMTFGRISSESELVLLRASGVSLSWFAMPVMVIAIICSSICFVLNDRGIGWGFLKARAALNSDVEIFIKKALRPGGSLVLKSDSSTQRQETYIRIAEVTGETENTKNTPIIIDNVHDKIIVVATEMASGFLMEVKNPPVPSGSVARKSVNNIAPILTLKLYNGVQILRVDTASQTTNRYTKKIYKIKLNTIGSGQVKWGDSLKTMSLGQIEFSRAVLPRGIGTEKRFRELDTEIQYKMAYSCSCIALALLAIAFGVRLRNFNWLTGAVSAITGMLFIYHFPILAMRTFSDKGVISPIIALWLPNVVMMILGVWLMQKETEAK